MPGRSIRIFLVDGQATGVRTLEIGLSTIKGVYAPRSAIEELSKRPESKKTGIYVLVGEDPAYPGRSAIYVGEGDNVLHRISAHHKDESKDFFDKLVLFVSKDFNLTKAHVRFLESKLIKLAKQSKRATVFNSTEPVGGTLPEADEAEMDEFLQQCRLLLVTLGITAFEAARTSPIPVTESDVDLPHEEIELCTEGKGYKAICIFTGSEFIVMKDSLARKEEVQSLSAASIGTRRQLLEAGVWKEVDEGFIFTQDYSFSSASNAAQIVTGQTVNGRIVWKLTSTGETLAVWQDQKLKAIEAADDDS